MNNISVIIITRNESKNIRRCVDSVSGFDDIVIVDSGSSDETVSIVKEYGANVFVRDFDDFASQKNYALSKCKNEWVLSLDADEVVTEDLKNEILDNLKKPLDANGFFIPRCNYIFNKKMQYGGHQNDYQLRLFKKNKAKFVQPIHEYLVIDGNTRRLNSCLMHYSSQNINDYVKKLNFYTDLEADLIASSKCRHMVFYMIFKPLYAFLNRYFLKSGYRDGFEGFLYYIFSSFYIFLKYAKALKLHKRKSRNWGDFYDNATGQDYSATHTGVHSDFFNIILSEDPKKAIELGCGSGIMSVYLSKEGADTIGIDNDERNIALAGKNNSVLRGNAKFTKADAFHLPYPDKSFDVAFSQGLLEHFDCQDIIKLIDEQLRVAKAVAFSVPNKFYNHKDFGDERLFTKKEWESILSKYDILVSDDYHYLRCKRNFCRRLPIMYMAKIKAKS